MTETLNVRVKFYEELIPEIKQHMIETGHLWHFVATTCHDCMEARNRYLLLRALMERETGDSQRQLKHIVAQWHNHLAFTDEARRLLGD